MERRTRGRCRAPAGLLIALTLLAAVLAGIAPPAARAQPPAEGGAPIRLVLPSIGVDATVAAFDLQDDQTMPVPQRASLVAWYTFSAQAGAFGNVVLAGHRDWQRERGVFYGLASVREGDPVWLEDQAGNLYLYIVEWSVSMADETAPVHAVVGPTGQPSLTLITCSGSFDRTTGRYLERHVVRAAFVELLPTDGPVRDDDSRR